MAVDNLVTENKHKVLTFVKVGLKSLRENKWHYIWEMLCIFLSVFLSVTFCSNTDLFLAHIDYKNSRAEYADDMRNKNEYNESLYWYEKIAGTDSEQSTYANLAIAEIYSREITNKRFEIALAHYKLAIENCEDIKVYNSALNFIIEQRKLQFDGENEPFLDMFSIENKPFVVDVINGMYSCNPEMFKDYNGDFPINEDDVESFFDKERELSFEVVKWKYVSTLTSLNGSLASTTETEKLVLVDSWSELISTTSFEKQRVYKYYRYKLKNETVTINAFDYIKNLVQEPEIIPVSSFKK